ncbi:hypothetical protein WDW86_19905 [Bdellovibrionota bacterium FG-2]
MSKVKTFVLVVFVGIGAVGFLGNSPWAEAKSCYARERHEARACIQGGGGGGEEIPTPLSSNDRVELADQEHYLLVGQVVIRSTYDVTGSGNALVERAYFEVDLSAHVWLANAKRRNDPGYPLEGSLTFWRKFQKMRVKVSVEAEGRILTNEAHQPEYVITLKALADPVRTD